MGNDFKKVLVTGGLGYIGSHTVLSLIESGFLPVIVDNLDNSSLQVHGRLEELADQVIPVYLVDVRNRALLEEVFHKEQISSVIHFAAKKSVSEGLSNPLYYYEHNVSGLINLLHVCEQFHVENFVFSSSCTVYGEAKELPVHEGMGTLKQTSPYGTTKRIGEELISEFSELNGGIKSLILRYFNPVGAHESGLLGELPNGIPSNIMPYVCQSAAGIRGPIQVFGDDYATADGTAIRDYIHVMDLAEAHVCALEYCMNGNEKINVFNVGTGTGYSVLDLLKTFEQTNNLKLNYSFGPRRSGDIEKIWADNNKARIHFNWEPKRNLVDMCRSAWRWQLFLMDNPK